MWTPIILILTFGALGYGGFELTRWTTRRMADVHANWIGLIKRDPQEAVRLAAHRGAPSLQRLEHKFDGANVHLIRARARTATELTAFPGEVVPDMAHRVGTWLLAGLWVVAAIAQFAFDYPIWDAVLGGNGRFAFLATVITALLVPMVLSVLLARAWRQRSRVEALHARAAIAALLLSMVAMVSIMVSLSPLRAQAEFRPQISTETIQVQNLKEHGHPVEATAEQAQVEELKQEEQQSESLNGVLIFAAGFVESLAGLAVPSAYHLVRYGSARRAETTAEDTIRATTNATAREQRRQVTRLARDFEEAGISVTWLTQQTQESQRGLSAPSTEHPQTSESSQGESTSARDGGSVPAFANSRAPESERPTDSTPPKPEEPPVDPRFDQS